MSFIEKKDNSWRAKISWYDANRKRHTKSKQGFETKRLAQQWANKMEVTKATLKRIKHVGDTIELIPDNDDYNTIILDKDHPGRILGKKIQMIRYGSR